MSDRPIPEAFNPHLLQREFWEVAIPFSDLAAWLNAGLEPGPKKEVAFAKLLEARNAAIRAMQQAVAQNE